MMNDVLVFNKYLKNAFGMRDLFFKWLKLKSMAIV